MAAGGALIEPAPAAAFALVALVLALTALPTVMVTRRLALGEHGAKPAKRERRAGVRDVLARAGAREALLAQTMWVFGYAALPAFFVLYAENSLGLGIGAAGALPLAFGVLTALGIVLAGRARPERVHGLLVAGAALLGVGLLGAAPATSIAAAALPFAVAAVGAGLVTALGFPYFARFVPEGEAGRYSGVFFASRAVASAAALPLAGVLVELSGTYRAVLWFGVVPLAAVVPLVMAQRRALGRVSASPGLVRPSTVAAVMPVFASARAVETARATLSHVDRLVLVDDGAPPAVAQTLDEVAGDERVTLVALERNGGKGSALAAGIARLTAESRPPDAILLIDSDGQHDPERIPAFLDAIQDADVVIGNRRRRRSMPVARRVANRAASLAMLASARKWVPDTQNGMRLFRTEVLREVPLPEGGYEAESGHLRAVLAAGRFVASVEIPTIYDGEPSHSARWRTRAASRAR